MFSLTRRAGSGKKEVLIWNLVFFPLSVLTLFLLTLFLLFSLLPLFLFLPFVSLPDPGVLCPDPARESMGVL